MVPESIWAAWGARDMIPGRRRRRWSASPFAICCRARATARRPEPQTWLNAPGGLLLGNARGHRRLTGRVLALASGQHLAEDDDPARRKKIKARAAALISEERTLQELRHAHKLTQKRMAEVLGIGQDSVSRLEQRSDLLISTLRGYVEAMGGRLSLIAEFRISTRSSWPDSQPLSWRKPMGDGDSRPFSIERFRELLGTEDSGLQTRRLKQFGFKPTCGHTYSSTSISINNGKNGLARSLQMNAVRSRFGSENGSRWK